VHIPPGLDWFQIIEWYAFQSFVLFSTLYAIYELVRHKLRKQRAKKRRLTP